MTSQFSEIVQSTITITVCFEINDYSRLLGTFIFEFYYITPFPLFFFRFRCGPGAAVSLLCMCVYLRVRTIAVE